MSLRYYIDHHVARAITAGLRQRGIDCLTAAEDGRADAPDPGLLRRATALGRVMFSHDDDMHILGHEFQDRGEEFAGVVYARQLGITIGLAIRDLHLIAEAMSEEEIRNTVVYIPM